MQDTHPTVNRTLTRRQLLQLVGVGVGLTASAACTTASSTPAAGEETAVGTTEKKEVIFWGHEQHPLDLAAEGFVAVYPDIEWLSPHPVDPAEKMKAAFAAGTGLPDLYWAKVAAAQDWGCKALLTDLTEYLKPEAAQYHPAKLAETMVAKQGSQIGWPGDLGVSGWYYRQDKLQALGWNAVDLAALTWPDFIEMAAALRQQGFYTFCFPSAGWSALFFLILHQMGGTAVSQDGETITVGNPKGIDAMRLVKQLWETGGGLEADSWSPPYWAALKEGKLIGDFAAAWVKGFWEASLQDAAEANVLGTWQVAPLPGGDNILYRTGIWGGGQLVTPKAAANPENAILFMRYALGSVEGAARYGAWGVVPAYRPYLNSEGCAAQRSPLFGDWPFCGFWADQEKELSTAYFRPAGWDAINAAVQEEMMSIVLDVYAVEDGMSRIVERAAPDFTQTRCV